MRDSFAQDRVSSATEATADLPAFDGRRSMRYLEDICKLGPRISGTAGMKKQQELLISHFEAQGGKTDLQRFTVRQISQQGRVDMANLIVSWQPEIRRRVLLCAHYDTRPMADQEEDPRRWHKPFVSANDGGSGVALLMELAHHMKELKPQLGVDFVLFDGEEYIFDRDRDKYFFGSEHFAQSYQKSRGKQLYTAAIVLDMIGGKNLRIPIEQNSWFQARKLVEDVWTIAARLKCTAFEDRLGPSVLDDHLALNRVGIPAIDLIDFDYAHWHRLSDVPANCSAASLDQVARVVMAWLQRVK